MTAWHGIVHCAAGFIHSEDFAYERKTFVRSPGGLTATKFPTATGSTGSHGHVAAGEVLLNILPPLTFGTACRAARRLTRRAGYPPPVMSAAEWPRLRRRRHPLQLLRLGVFPQRCEFPVFLRGGA
jgi:hypothetical protein